MSASTRRRDRSLARLDTLALRRAVRTVTRADRDLAAVVRRHGPPPLWARRPGVATLVKIILEQQVSLASARALFRRMETSLGIIDHDSLHATGVVGLRKLGLTRQKAAYCCAIAEFVRSGTLDLRRVARAPLEEARRELMEVPGIGPWTADIYLLMVLRRPDVWPVGDLALHTALRNLRRMSRLPTSAEAAAEAARWSPWRSVAARILWHGYLEGSLRNGA